MNELKILLIEDTPDDEFLPRRILSKLDQNNVSVVHEGEQALRYLFGDETAHPGTQVRNRPDLILLDIRMPLVDGLDFLEAAHANLRTHDIPVIVVSSSRLEREVERCFELGAKAYLTKPIDSKELVRIIEQHCQSS